MRFSTCFRFYKICTILHCSKLHVFVNMLSQESQKMYLECRVAIKWELLKIFKILKSENCKNFKILTTLVVYFVAHTLLLRQQYATRWIYLLLGSPRKRLTSCSHPKEPRCLFERPKARHCGTSRRLSHHARSSSVVKHGDPTSVGHVSLPLDVQPLHRLAACSTALRELRNG